MPLGNEPAGNTTTTTVTQPWEAQQAPLKYGFDQARQIYNSASPSYYPGATLADWTDAQRMGNEAQIGRAMGGSPVNAAAEQNILGVLNGDYLNGNPNFDAMLEQTFRKVRPAVDQQFSGENYGGSAHQAAITDSFTDAGTRLGYQNYNDERNRQMAALGMAPAQANQDYFDISKLQEAGNAQQDQTQAAITEDIKRYNYNENLQKMKLADYMKMIQGNYGNSSTQTQPYYDNTLGGILGALLGVGGAAVVGSDRRMKENIERIGTADNGVALYRFNYKGDPRVQVGVMAQDIESDYPDAVHEIDGLKFVDYSNIFPMGGV